MRLPVFHARSNVTKPPRGPLGTVRVVRASARRALARYGWPAAAWVVVVNLVVVALTREAAPPAPLPETTTFADRASVRVIDPAERDCLALNIYFEARGEPIEGKQAVAHVVLNRVRDPKFPATICQVVRQGGEEIRHRCQFSWWCDGRSDRPADPAAWDESRFIAAQILEGVTRDPTDGALWYHADWLTPDWVVDMTEGRRIGQHIFYHRRGRDARPSSQRGQSTMRAASASAS